MPEPTPTTLAGLTPAWLTEELRRSDTIGQDATVTAVDQEVLGEGEGFMGIVARLSLSYDGAAGPASMIAKIPTDVDANRATGRAIGVYEREVRVYSQVLPGLDIPKPKVYSAIYETDGHEEKLAAQTRKADRLPFWLLRRLIKREQGKSDVPPCVLLIEDLSDVDIGDQVAGGSPEQMTAALSTLARIHALTWNKNGIPDAHWSQGPEYIPRLIHALYLNSREDFLKVGAPYLSPHTVGLYKSLKATGVTRVARHRDEVPQCLAHGDYRLDNMFFNADNEVAAVIDWQTAVPGPVVLDVGYFLVSSLAAETPQSTVDDLLAHYHRELVANGISDYSMEQFIADYEDGLLIVMHRLSGLASDIVDLGDGRGIELMQTWFKRLDARMARVSL